MNELYIYTYIYIYILSKETIYRILDIHMYIYIYKYYIYIIQTNLANYGSYTARTGVLPGEVFYAFWDVGGMAEWLTRLVSKTQNSKP
jgi:hypothetical protein